MCGRHEMLDDHRCSSIKVAPQSQLHDFRMLGVNISSWKSGLPGQSLIAITEIMNFAAERHQLGGIRSRHQGVVKGAIADVPLLGNSLPIELGTTS